MDMLDNADKQKTPLASRDESNAVKATPAGETKIASDVIIADEAALAVAEIDTLQTVSFQVYV